MAEHENLIPNADGSSLQLTIYPVSPTTHYDKAQIAEGNVAYPPGMRVYNTVGVWRLDLWYFPNTVRRDEGIKKLIIGQYCWGNNWSVSYRKSIKQGGLVYDVTPNITFGGGAQHWDYIVLSTSPSTGLPWTLSEVDNLEAGVKIFDSGIPSGGFVDAYFIRACWKDAAVRTDPPTNYTGNAATLNGKVMEDEGFSTLTVKFQWGLTTAYGNTTSNQSKAEGDLFSANISGLDPTKIYHCRAVIVTPAGETFYGLDMPVPFLPSGGKNLAGDLVKEAYI